MSYRTQVVKFCEDHDIKLYDYSIPGFKVDITLWTPKGTRFKGLVTHNAVAVFWTEPGYGKNEAWKGLVEDIQGGLEPCDDPQCDTCHNPEPLMPSDF